MQKVFALIAERKNPPDKRVVLPPQLCKELIRRHPKARIIVEKSDIRIFSDQEYVDAGFEVKEDVSEADVMLGVKEVPIEHLIPRKTYLFFSHTIKKQPYNRDLLKAVLDKQIVLIDHETLRKSNGVRLVAFGRYAGIVGAYNGIRMFGLKEKLFRLPKAEDLYDLTHLKSELDKIQLPAIKIIVTGEGKVGKGALEILEHLKVRRVNVQDFLKKEYNEPVYCNIHPIEYVQRIDAKPKTKMDFYAHPEQYKNGFLKFAKVADVFIAGHFFADGSPEMLSEENLRDSQLKLRYIADISCDIGFPIASTLRPSTIADPFYGYNSQTGQEIPFDAPDAIAVMAVDNLPCELPRDASIGFGTKFLENVVPSFFNNDKHGILGRAALSHREGGLTPKFSYLADYVFEDV